MKAEQKRTVMIVGVLVVLCAAIIGAISLFTGIRVPDRSVLDGKPDYQAAYDKALEYQKKSKSDPSDIVNYIVEGNSWKMIGDSFNDPAWYRLSLAAYERGIKVTGQKNSLLLTNAAQVAVSLGDYETAKRYYLISIDLSPGDANYHLSYIKLLVNKLHAPEQEVLRAYDDAMSRVVGGADLVSSRAQYLKSIGRYKDARADFQLLFNNKIITQDQYNSELAEIQQLESSHQ